MKKELYTWNIIEVLLPPQVDKWSEYMEPINNIVRAMNFADGEIYAKTDTREIPQSGIHFNPVYKIAILVLDEKQRMIIEDLGYNIRPIQSTKKHITNHYTKLKNDHRDN